MNFLKELVSSVPKDGDRRKSELPHFLGEPGFFRWTGTGDYRYSEKFSKDETKKQFWNIRGGRKYEGRWTKDVELYTQINGGGWHEMMRALAIVKPFQPGVEYIVLISALTEDPAHPSTVPYTTVGYSSKEDGVMKISGNSPSTWTLVRNQGEAKVDIAEMKKNGVYSLEELPVEIDVVATVELFLQKMHAEDFSKQQFVLKNRGAE